MRTTLFASLLSFVFFTTTHAHANKGGASSGGGSMQQAMMIGIDGSPNSANKDSSQLQLVCPSGAIYNCKICHLAFLNYNEQDSSQLESFCANPEMYLSN